MFEKLEANLKQIQIHSGHKRNLSERSPENQSMMGSHKKQRTLDASGRYSRHERLLAQQEKDKKRKEQKSGRKKKKEQQQQLEHIPEEMEEDPLD
jgi:hypothetical protein